MGVISLGLPVRNQLAPVAGRVVQNGNMDCIWESEGSIIQYYWPDTRVSGDEIIDFIKGPKYTGAGNAAWSVGDVGHHFGIDVGCFKSSDPHRLIAALRDYAAQGVPCLVTIPSAWNSQPSRAGYTPLAPRFPSHVCALDAIDSAIAPGGIVQLMNPWPTGYAKVGAGYQQVSVAWLQQRLCYGSIWPVTKFSAWRDLAAMPGWEDDGVTLRKKGSVVGFVKGFRKYSLLHPELFTGLFADQEPLENEHPFGAGTEQTLTYLKYVWTPNGGVRLEPNQRAA